MLMVRHPNRRCEDRALMARLLAALCPALVITPDTPAGAIARALRRDTDLDAGTARGGQPGRALTRRGGGA